jgi:hypothetical protein
MAFRITRVPGDDGDLVRIAGRLASEGLGELQQVLDGANLPLSIDLGELQSADSAALSLLQRLESDGVRLVGASPYLRMLLSSRR